MTIPRGDVRSTVIRAILGYWQLGSIDCIAHDNIFMYWRLCHDNGRNSGRHSTQDPIEDVLFSSLQRYQCFGTLL